MGMNKNIFLKKLNLLLIILYPAKTIYCYYTFISIHISDIWGLRNAISIIELIFYQTLILIIYLKINIQKDSSTIDRYPYVQIQEENNNYDEFNSIIREEIEMRIKRKNRICGRCKNYKPPRSHHCSICDRCYFKMDHHYVWFGICINFVNYKYFLVFLLATLVADVFKITIFFIDFLIVSLDNEKLVNYIVVLSLSGVELFIVVSLLIFHLYLLSNNETSIDYHALNSYLKGDLSKISVFQEGAILSQVYISDWRVLNPYNLGLKDNIRQVFRISKWKALLSTFTSISDGVNFQKNYEKRTFLRLSLIKYDLLFY